MPLFTGGIFILNYGDNCNTKIKRRFTRMNPFRELPKDSKINYSNWNSIAVKPYDKNSTDPYTKTRVI